MAKTVYTKNGNATTKIDRTDTTKGGTAPTGTKIKNDSVGLPMYNTAGITNAAQAMNGQDAIGQDMATRLWQSYKTMGQNQIDESNKRFEEAYVNADLQAQSRGMGRSSFLNQTLANIDKNKAEYAAKIDADTVAQFQQALNNLEQRQQEQANFEAQLNQSNQQWSQQMAMQYISNILANNGNASDALLEQAGLSRKDFEAMKKQQATGGGGAFRNRTNDNTGDESGDTSTWSNFWNLLFGNNGTGNTGTATTGSTSTGGTSILNRHQYVK